MKFPVRLIAGASVLVCAAGVARAQEIGLRRPVVQSTVIKPDTVWFCGTILGSERVSYYFARQTRAWGEATVPQTAPCSNAGMAMRRPSITDAGAGVRFVIVSPAQGRTGRAYLRVVDSTRGRATEPLRRLDPAVFPQLPKLGEFAPDSVTPAVGGAAVDDSTIWIGLRGGFDEGEGNYGGLIRIDRRSSAADWIHDSLIVYREVTGIVDAGRSLLVAAVTDGEYGPYGDVGLLRFDKASRTWRTYSDSAPDKLIRILVNDGRLVALATEHGLGVADLRDGVLSHWSNVWFVPRLVGDSMVYGLGPKDRAPETPAAEAPWVFAQRYALIGHERFIHDALSALEPWRAVAAAFSYVEDSVTKALADTSLVPMLTRMLSQPPSQHVAALALARLGARASTGAADSLRRQFLAGGHNRPALAKALLAGGDSMPRDWARAVLDTAVRTHARGNGLNDAFPAVEILSEMHDRPSLPNVIALAGTANRSTYNFFSARLAAFDDPMAWNAMLSLEREGKLGSFEVMMFLRPSALTDSTVHGRARDLLRREIAVDSLRQMALLAVQRLGMIELAPDIIEKMSAPQRPGATNTGITEVQALVRLSGRADAPIWTGSPPPPAVRDWWLQWWSSTNGAAVAVSDNAGRQALREWMNRFFAARPR